MTVPEMPLQTDFCTRISQKISDKHGHHQKLNRSACRGSVLMMAHDAAIRRLTACPHRVTTDSCARYFAGACFTTMTSAATLAHIFAMIWCQIGFSSDFYWASQATNNARLAGETTLQDVYLRTLDGGRSSR